MVITYQPIDLDVTLRPVGEGDELLLFELYASTRADELAPVPWDAAQREAFLRSQFAAQSRCYHSDYPGAAFQVIQVAGQFAGRLYVHPREKEIRIMDIALLPEYRRRGIGRRLLQQVLDEGAAQGKTVTIHVEVFNPALQLYESLGFKKTETHGLYHLLEWVPAAFQLAADPSNLAPLDQQ